MTVAAEVLTGFVVGVANDTIYRVSIVSGLMRIFILRVGFGLNLCHRSVTAFTLLSRRLCKFSGVVVTSRALHLSCHAVLHRHTGKNRSIGSESRTRKQGSEERNKEFFHVSSPVL